MKKYDIIVAGGGFAGAAAAISAGRLGKKVLLFDKSNCMGGAACNCLVFPFMPYTTKINGERKALCAGIFTEMLLEVGVVLLIRVGLPIVLRIAVATASTAVGYGNAIFTGAIGNMEHDIYDLIVMGYDMAGLVHIQKDNTVTDELCAEGEEGFAVLGSAVHSIADISRIAVFAVVVFQTGIFVVFAGRYAVAVNFILPVDKLAAGALSVVQFTFADTQFLYIVGREPVIVTIIGAGSVSLIAIDTGINDIVAILTGGGVFSQSIGFLIVVGRVNPGSAERCESIFAHSIDMLDDAVFRAGLAFDRHAKVVLSVDQFAFLALPLIDHMVVAVGVGIVPANSHSKFTGNVRITLELSHPVAGTSVLIANTTACTVLTEVDGI